jgi:hypothetical protein
MISKLSPHAEEKISAKLFIYVPHKVGYIFATLLR